MSPLKSLCLAATIFCVSIAADCRASMITYESVGEVTSVNEAAAGFPTELLGALGSSISVRISYDTGVIGSPDAVFVPGTRYEFTPSQAAMTIFVNGESLAINAEGFLIEIANDYDSGGPALNDAFIMHSVQLIEQIADQHFAQFGNTRLVNDTLTDESLPNGPINLAPAAFNLGRFDSGLNYEQWLAAVFRDPPTLVTSEVPEPSSLALFGMGAAGLGGIRWRRRRLTNPAASDVPAT